MKQQADRSRAKKTLRVATALTGVTTGAALLAPAAPADATANYQIHITTLPIGDNGPGSIYQVQICGYNQNNNWVCTPGRNISHNGADSQYWKNNWWWHGKIQLWWNGHHSQSWNQCSIPNPSKYVGYQSANWIYLYAGFNQHEC